MTKYLTTLTLFALVGITLCALAASQAKAYSCHTSCYTVGSHQYCNTYCL